MSLVVPAQHGADADQAGERQPSLCYLIRTRTTRFDIAMLAVVPIVLLAVYALPTETRRALALSHTAPTLVTAFTSHYVHLSGWHLAANLGGYLLIVPTAFALSVACGRKRQFQTVFTVFVLCFPFVLSGLNLVFERATLGVGASGILLAFVGYLPITIAGVAGSLLTIPVDRIRSKWLFFVGLALIALLVAPSLYGIALAVAAMLAALLFLLPIVEEADAVAPVVRRVIHEHPGDVELLGLGVVVFLGYPFVAFSDSLTVQGTVVNVYTHLLGFCLGYVATYVTVLVGGFSATRRTTKQS